MPVTPSSSTSQPAGPQALASAALYGSLRRQLPVDLDTRPGLDRELRADDAGAPLRVKFGAVPWVLTDIDARQAHQRAAWDQVHAAFSHDARRLLCERDEALAARAWEAMGLPARGRPITARHAHAAHRLVELLALAAAAPCDGSRARRAQVNVRLALALGVLRYEQRHVPVDDDWSLETPASRLMTEGWALLQTEEGQGLGPQEAMERVRASQVQPAKSSPN